MGIEVDAKTLAAAVKGLGLNVPIYHARKVRGGVEVVTRHGVQVWRPAKRPGSLGPRTKGKTRSVGVSKSGKEGTL